MARPEPPEDYLEMVEPADVLVAYPAQRLDVAGRKPWDPSVTPAAPPQSQHPAGFAWLATGRRRGAGRGGFWFAFRLWFFLPHLKPLLLATNSPTPAAYLLPIM